MKRSLILFICFIGYSSFAYSQKDKQLRLKSKLANDDYLIENITTSKSLVQVLDSIKKLGYYTMSLDSVITINNESIVYLDKGRLYGSIWVKNDTIYHPNNTTYTWFETHNLDSLAKSVINYYTKKGYPFCELKINEQGVVNDVRRVELLLKLNPKRYIDSIKIEGYEKVPTPFLRYGLGLKKNMIYDEFQLKEISNSINKNPYITEIKPIQTLFNPSITTVYLYLKKKKINLFDGILGFANDKNGIFKLNGNIKLSLENNFNTLEKIAINWNSTPDKSQNLKVQIKLPYLFNSPIGSESQLNFYKQDSTFANFKAKEKIFYQLTKTSNIGIEFNYEKSSYVAQTTSMIFQNFNKTGTGIFYDYYLPIAHQLMEAKNRVSTFGIKLNRNNEETMQTSNQYHLGLKMQKIINYKNHFLVDKIDAEALISNTTYLQNELLRFGGFGSLRGVNEESLFANAFIINSLEYRFAPNDGFYISLFGDYCIFEKNINKLNESILGIGSGFSFLTKLGIFNLSFATAKFSNTNFDFNNAKIHFGIISRF